MYEFHGWVNIVAGDLDAPATSILRTRRNDPIAALEHRLQKLRSAPFLFVHMARDLNGETHLLISGCRNHRDERPLDLFRWVAQHLPGSYGLLHVRDDEDREGRDNAFVVHVMKRGSLSSGVDGNLSPCIPELEEPSKAEAPDER